MNLVILTEGTQTEIIYFKALASRYSRQDIEIRAGKSSDPIRLLNEAIQIQKSSSGNVWIVLDAEAQGQDPVRDRRLKKALLRGPRYGLHFALSKPCFEAWLLSHFGDGTQDYTSNAGSQFYAELLSRKLGATYQKNNYNVNLLLNEANLHAASQSPAGANGLATLLHHFQCGSPE